MKKNKVAVEYESIDCNVLAEDMGYALIKAISGYEEAIEKAAERYEPSVIARYLVAVATSFNRFYHECPILQAEEKTKKARLVLVDLVQRLILDACSLLGMSCPEEM
ncbi:DALR anticodon-binding domain-containing protein [Lacrimispora sp.]|uniref:DALR anticodon-binding domain-containing protein n=1 Tax=Lacrimispora sp. TaxID=2719234 RepID=UPI00289F897E|nr:DALR anticodon-binding domain-containing protein [Lacrimispora sp.]